MKEIVTTITSRRFVIAVGGRPTPLDISVGGELAITSDDLFMKKVRYILHYTTLFVMWCDVYYCFA